MRLAIIIFSIAAMFVIIGAWADSDMCDKQRAGYLKCKHGSNECNIGRERAKRK